MREIKLNIERALQKQDKKERAAELVIANKELAYQNSEKEKRAAELIIANKELVFQNAQKELREAELVVANVELSFQNSQKEKRAAELVIANAELTFQNDEKEKRAAELVNANRDLESFTFISSHDLQEPLRKIQIFSGMILSQENENLSASGKRYLAKIRASALHMQALITDLQVYTSTSAAEKFEKKDLRIIVQEVQLALEEEVDKKKATIEADGLCELTIIPSQFRQLLLNLIGNSLKFSKAGQPPHIVIKSVEVKSGASVDNVFSPKKDYCHISVTDNGIGFQRNIKTGYSKCFNA